MISEFKSIHFCLFYENALIQSYPSLKQNEKKENIEKLKSQIVNMKMLKNSGLSNVTQKDVCNLKSQLKKEEKELNRLIQLQQSQLNFRDKKKRLLQSDCDKGEKAAKALKTVNRYDKSRNENRDSPLILYFIP